MNIIYTFVPGLPTAQRSTNRKPRFTYSVQKLKLDQQIIIKFSLWLCKVFGNLPSNLVVLFQSLCLRLHIDLRVFGLQRLHVHPWESSNQLSNVERLSMQLGSALAHLLLSVAFHELVHMPAGTLAIEQSPGFVHRHRHEVFGARDPGFAEKRERKKSISD